MSYYSLILSVDTASLIKEYFNTLVIDNMSIVARFITDDHGTYDRSDFLAAELGIFNKTVSDIFGPAIYGFNATEARDLEVRAAMCTAISLSTVCGIWQIIYVVESKMYIKAGTGYLLESCKSVMGFLKISGPMLISAEVNQYCASFLSFVVKCNGADAEATYEKNNGIEMTVFNSQKDYNCDNMELDRMEYNEETIS
ncbi:hypothetical protein BDV36DRAFT_281801 [Aspergillus pseudocaelatus]|uniref:Uncharacterized protein n=1 Tax=Aspergillus pseudocaelatus TaxID=1825620 RepID=A0ABQ6WSC1_9EURO|nr:hypothetical protein BDV36DRAFT_281801 [Aspergillus pseudocaelatus]